MYTPAAWPKLDSAAPWDASHAIAQALQAQSRWAAQPVRQRLVLVRHLRHLIAQRADELVKTLPDTANRSRADTLVSEVLPLADACRFLERAAERLLAPKRLRRRYRPLWLSGVMSEVHRQPWGLVLVIAPSNYPLLLPGVQLIQALVAGNAVLLKPGAGGLAAASMLKQLGGAAGLDEALVQVLPEEPGAASDAIACGVDKVVLTGSAETGVEVSTALAPHLTPATMELSGCDAAFVQSDADLELVVPALEFSLRLNGGATCIAPRRVFVDRRHTESLTTQLASRVEDMGLFAVNPKALQTAQQLVQQSCQRGARLVCGGFEGERHMRPVILADVTPDMAVSRTDVLAPMLSLMGVDNDAVALKAAERCSYALGAVVFGQEAAARAMATQVRAGVVVVNDVIVPTADPRLPFGGLGRSGYGVTRGAEGLLEMTTIKSLAVRRGRWRPHFEPPQAGHDALFHAYIQTVHSASWRQRLSALWSGVQTLMQLDRPSRNAKKP